MMRKGCEERLREDVKAACEERVHGKNVREEEETYRDNVRRDHEELQRDVRRGYRGTHMR